MLEPKCRNRALLVYTTANRRITQLRYLRFFDAEHRKTNLIFVHHQLFRPIPFLLHLLLLYTSQPSSCFAPLQLPRYPPELNLCPCTLLSFARTLCLTSYVRLSPLRRLISPLNPWQLLHPLPTLQQQLVVTPIPTRNAGESSCIPLPPSSP